MASYDMRAWNTNLTSHVTWRVSGTPDFTGASSPYPPGDLTDIQVANTITSGTTPGEAGGEWNFPPMTAEDMDLPVDALQPESGGESTYINAPMAEHP
jgi:hypothetical protein